MGSELVKPTLREVQFISQHSPDLVAFAKTELGDDVESKAICWLACIIMCMSPHLDMPYEQQVEVIRKFLQTLKPQNAVGDMGLLFEQAIPELSATINTVLALHAPGIQSTIIIPIMVSDLAIELKAGKQIIFGSGNSERRHMMVIDKVLEDGSDLVYCVYNPAAANALDGRIYLNLAQFHRNFMQNGIKLSPRVISIGPTTENLAVLT